MNSELNQLQLDCLNSITKYPSIPTYHSLGERGSLLEGPVSFIGPVVATEKVDGTNGRIVLCPGGEVLIGSREGWLHALRDVVHNPALGIVDALIETAERAEQLNGSSGALHAFYFEVFGGKVTAASKQYTSKREVSIRLFDSFSIGEFDLPPGPPHAAARWREMGGQPFKSETELARTAELLEVELTPRIECPPPPSEIADTLSWLEENIPTSLVTLDGDAGAQPEGLVIRSESRSTIAKVRLQDYRRHVKRLGADR